MHSTVQWLSMLNEHIEAVTENCGPLPMKDLNHREQAQTDIFRLKRHIKMASKRKTCPVHSPPTAILCLALLPDWQFEGSKADRMQGIGNNTAEKLEAPLYAKAMEDGYIHINASGCTPLKWHRSDGACIPKNNGKEGPLANRVVHRLDEQGKGFFAGKMRAKDKKKGPGNHVLQLRDFSSAGEGKLAF